MLVQAEDDPVHVENAFYYWLHLKQNQVKSELHLYPTGGHGYGRCKGNTPPPAESNGIIGLTAIPGVDQVCTWPDRGVLFLQTVGIAPKNATA
jgi:hypothetical protein